MANGEWHPIAHRGRVNSRKNLTTALVEVGPPRAGIKPRVMGAVDFQAVGRRRDREEDPSATSRKQRVSGQGHAERVGAVGWPLRKRESGGPVRARAGRLMSTSQ